MTNTTGNNQGCFTAIRRFLGISTPQVQAIPTPEAEPLPYRVRDDFLSPAELSFYHVLLSAIGQRAVACPKVNLADLLFVARPHENQSYRYRIAQKHLDFLLCEPKSMRPIVGIELNDASHTRANRQARDEFIVRVFQAAGLPLIQVPVQSSYNTNDLSARLAPYLEKTDKPGSASVEAAQVPANGITTSTTPLCPKCGMPMVIRTAARGEHQGKQFYGCPNYPKCREVLPFR